EVGHTLVGAGAARAVAAGAGGVGDAFSLGDIRAVGKGGTKIVAARCLNRGRLGEYVRCASEAPCCGNERAYRCAPPPNTPVRRHSPKPHGDAQYRSPTPCVPGGRLEADATRLRHDHLFAMTRERTRACRPVWHLSRRIRGQGSCALESLRYIKGSSEVATKLPSVGKGMRRALWKSLRFPVVAPDARGGAPPRAKKTPANAPAFLPPAERG